MQYIGRKFDYVVGLPRDYYLSTILQLVGLIEDRFDPSIVKDIPLPGESSNVSYGSLVLESYCKELEDFLKQTFNLSDEKIIHDEEANVISVALPIVYAIDGMKHFTETKWFQVNLLI